MENQENGHGKVMEKCFVKSCSISEYKTVLLIDSNLTLICCSLLHGSEVTLAPGR